MIKKTSAGSLDLVFTNEVIAKLKGASQTDSLVYRVGVLTDDPPPDTHVPWLSAQRAAWSEYVDAARACGMFEDPHGKDLMTRLAHVDDDQFRSAMAECQAAWYLSHKLGLTVSARPRGRGASVLELLVALPDGDVLVEVKSPLRVAIADGLVRKLDDSDILDRCLADASRQLRKDARNLVMLVGRVTLGTDHRRFFMKAFYAEERWVFNRRTMESSIEYDLTGRFLKVWPGEDGPRHTRVGGVLFVQEQLRHSLAADGTEVHRTDNDALIMHNPYALRPLPEEPWGDCPQLVLRGDSLEWTDGVAVGGPTPS